MRSATATAISPWWSRISMPNMPASSARSSRRALRDFKHDGRTLARFFFVSDPDGYKIEVIQRGGRFG